MRTTVGTIGAIFLFLAGCGSSRVTHTLDANDPVVIVAGGCVLVAGPYPIPGGATTYYSVYDDNQDDMDIAVIDDSFGCDPAAADIAYTSGVGSVTSPSDVIPVSSTYNLAISCFNIVEDCIPTVDSWEWSN